MLFAMTLVLIRNAHLIDTVPTVRVLRETDLLIDGDSIREVGRGLSAPGATVIDAAGRIVLPGLIDTHRHTWQTALRGMLRVGTLGDYLARFLQDLGPRYTPEDVHIGNLAGAVDALDAGITTLLDWSHIQNSPEHTDAAVAGLRESGIRGVFAHSFGLPLKPGPHSPDARRVRETHFASSDGLLDMALGIAGPQFGDPDIAADDIRLARELGCRVTVHIHSSAGVETLDELGMLGPDLTFVHANGLDAAAMRRLADTGAAVSVSPQVEAQLGMGAPLIAPLLALGVPTSLSVDTVTSAAGDLFTQMRLALSFARLADPAVSAADILRMATVDGARALGLDDRIGSLRVGSRADLVMLGDRLPVHDPVGTVVAEAERGDVDTVLVDGRVVKRGGQLTAVDTAGIAERLAASAERLLGRPGDETE